MSDYLDDKTLLLISELMDISTEKALLVQRLWSDRARLVSVSEQIRDWDVMHSEALSVDRVQQLIAIALMEVGE